MSNAFFLNFCLARSVLRLSLMYGLGSWDVPIDVYSVVNYSICHWHFSYCMYWVITIYYVFSHFPRCCTYECRNLTEMVSVAFYNYNSIALGEIVGQLIISNVTSTCFGFAEIPAVHSIRVEFNIQLTTLIKFAGVTGIKLNMHV